MERQALIPEQVEPSPPGKSLTARMIRALAQGTACRFVATGQSMSPFVKDGDVITVSPLRGREPRTGEIVAFLHPASGRAAVHRIVRTGPGHVLIRGDNSYGVDGSLAGEQILGVVTDVVRDGKRVRGVSSRWSHVIAFLSRTGGLVRALRLMRLVTGRRGRGTP